MAFGVSQKVSHDISSAFGKGLHGLKMETMATPKKGAGKRLSGRAVAESVMLGVFTITVAAIPVIVTHVPAPESLITVMELLQDWCTPSICFVVLIVGVMIATSGVWGSDAGSLPTPEQNHKTFTEAYLSQGPVSATQMDPLRMPDIFFSPEAARAHALSHSAAFPVRIAAQPTSVMVPVYYPALIPSQPKEMEANDRFLPRHEGMFESNGGERFVDERFVDDRFVPRGDGRFSPRVEERFSPERFTASTGEERFVPRVEERFSPDRFVNPQVDEMYVPQVQEIYPEAEERYVPEAQEMYPEVQGMYPEVQEMYPEVEERYESQEQDRFEPEEDMYDEPEEDSTRYVGSTRYDAPHVESTTAHDDDEARSESEDEGRYEPVEDGRAHSDEVEFEREEDRDYVESEADEVEPQVEPRSDVEDEVEHYPHESYEDDEQSLPEVVSPPRAPESPAAPQLSPSERSSSCSNATVTPDVEPASSLLSRRKPPTVPTPVIVQKAPPPPEPVTTNSPQDPTERVERKETLETATRPSVLSPRTPPRHASGRRPLSSSSSRSYAEFVRRTSNFSPRAPLEPPRPLAIPKPPSEPVVGRSTSTNSPAGGSALMKQMSMPARRPREVMVVDDDKLEENEATQGLGEDDDVDQRVEAFLKNFREQMRLQRQESLQRHRRGVLD